MSNFPEPSTPGFVPVYQLTRTDAVDAGAAGDGPSNLPLKNLVERTAYLKKEVEDLDTALGGVVIGSTVQAYDDDLQAIAALTTTGLIDRTGAGTATTRATGNTGLAVLASANEAAARTAVGVGAITNRNRLINGGMAIDQRNEGSAQTITAGAALAYTVDRWYAYCTGANVTGQQVQGATAGRFRYQFTGAASVTGIGFGQRIEQLNSADLAGTTATLSLDLANSLLTTVTWTAYYANTADTFGTLASPTRTQIATGTFTINSTITRYSTQIAIPIAAVTGIEIVLSVGAQTSGTWTIGNVQLEPGSVVTPFETRLYGNELTLCQRYYYRTQLEGRRSGGIWIPEAMGGTSMANFMGGTIWFPVDMRITPSGTVAWTFTDGGYDGKVISFGDGLSTGITTVKAAISTNAYFPGGSGNYGTFRFLATFSSEL